jgi:RNA polymerase sigma-70 factor (ECF subfamily)
MQNVIDPTLIKSVKNQEAGAFKRMYNECIGYVYAIVRRYVNHEDEHPDVIQEIFAHLFLNIGSYDAKKGPFKPWLRRLTINRCIEHYRKNKTDASIVPIEKAPEKSNEKEIQWDQLSRTEIENYLAKMPLGYRQVFMLVAIDEYSHKETAQLLNISAETSRSQFMRAKNWIRNRLLVNDQKTIVNGL